MRSYSEGVSTLLERLESGVLFQEGKLDLARRPVALLTDDDLGDALVLGLLVIDLIAVDEDDQVGVLLDRTAFAEIRQLRDAVAALFDGTAQLREGDHRHSQLFG